MESSSQLTSHPVTRHPSFTLCRMLQITDLMFSLTAPNERAAPSSVMKKSGYPPGHANSPLRSWDLSWFVVYWFIVGLVWLLLVRLVYWQREQSKSWRKDCQQNLPTSQNFFCRIVLTSYQTLKNKAFHAITSQGKNLTANVNFQPMRQAKRQGTKLRSR